MKMAQLILSGHQPEYLPYLGFFYKVLKSDKFVLVDHIQFTKKKFQNRNRIRDSKGPLWLTVPVLSKGKQFQAINEVKINNAIEWRKKHLRSLQCIYGKAPFFEECYVPLEKLYDRKFTHLSELNIELIKAILALLGIRRELFISSEYGFTGAKTELLIQMCKQFGCTAYLSGEGGRKYVEEEMFRKVPLDHLYSDFKHPVYEQFQGGEFFPFLSIIDCIFNIGAERTLELLENAHD